MTPRFDKHSLNTHARRRKSVPANSSQDKRHKPYAQVGAIPIPTSRKGQFAVLVLNSFILIGLLVVYYVYGERRLHNREYTTLENHWAAHEQARNLQSRFEWHPYQHHRDHVTQLVMDASQARLTALANAQMNILPTVALLGAGNLNDIDLNRLRNSYSHISLFDLDRNAMVAGLSRQNISSQENIALHVADLTGVYHLLSQLHLHRTKSDHMFETILQSLATNSTHQQPQDTYDVVVSLCMLSQINLAAWRTAGGDDTNASPFTAAKRQSLVFAVRDHHLKQMTEMLAPSGTALLVTDVVSSDTQPSVLQAQTIEDLNAILDASLFAGNFFIGTRPAEIRAQLKSSQIVTSAPNVRVHGIWKWTVNRPNGGQKAYLVTAVEWQRA